MRECVKGGIGFKKHYNEVLGLSAQAMIMTDAFNCGEILLVARKVFGRHEEVSPVTAGMYELFNFVKIEF